MRGRERNLGNLRSRCEFCVNYFILAREPFPDIPSLKTPAIPALNYNINGLIHTLPIYNFLPPQMRTETQARFSLLLLYPRHCSLCALASITSCTRDPRSCSAVEPDSPAYRLQSGSRVRSSFISCSLEKPSFGSMARFTYQ